MFTISKTGKGKAYKTDNPAKAQEAYKLKKSMSMYHEGNVVKSKAVRGAGTTGVWKEFIRVGVK